MKTFKEWLSEYFGWEIEPYDIEDEEEYYRLEDMYYKEMEEQR